MPENFVNSKAESEAQKVVLGEVDIPEDNARWLIYVDRKTKAGKGLVTAQPMVIRKLSDEERMRKEAEKKARKEAWEKKLAESKKKKEAERKAIAERKAKRKAEKKKKLEEELAKLG